MSLKVCVLLKVPEPLMSQIQKTERTVHNDHPLRDKEEEHMFKGMVVTRTFI